MHRHPPFAKVAKVSICSNKRKAMALAKNPTNKLIDTRHQIHPLKESFCLTDPHRRNEVEVQVCLPFGSPTHSFVHPCQGNCILPVIDLKQRPSIHGCLTQSYFAPLVPYETQQL